MAAGGQLKLNNYQKLAEGYNLNTADQARYIKQLKKINIRVQTENISAFSLILYLDSLFWSYQKIGF